jgi:hypothetical protein
MENTEIKVEDIQVAPHMRSLIAPKYASAISSGESNALAPQTTS